MKINYQQKMEEICQTIKGKPKLLLHSCCAPCSSAVLERLLPYFTITIYYYNPNITDAIEYQKRLEEEKHFIKEFAPQVHILDGAYEPDLFYQISKGFEQEKEGGSRCHKCYYMRMKQTALIAKQKQFEYFTTTLSVSPYKNSDILNQIGENLEKEIGISYLYADFKKKNGYQRSIELSNTYHLYRQNYCGCLYSKERKEEHV